MKKLEYMTEPELAEVMRGLADRMMEYAKEIDLEKPKFVLLLFNDPAIAQYISNVMREDVIKSLRETAGRLERREDVVRAEGRVSRLAIYATQGEADSIFTRAVELIQRLQWQREDLLAIAESALAWWQTMLVDCPDPEIELSIRQKIDQAAAAIAKAKDGAP